MQKQKICDECGLVHLQQFEIDWGEIIVDIVKKKDLDAYEFADCWTEDYDWTELDRFVINNFHSELIDWGLTYLSVYKDKYKHLQDWKQGDVENDLNKYQEDL